ncbi:MAG: RICIN domain-containing protein [Clostridia bacterium]|nr:RICIN domain-containing protein [Clostridia bacterium]
MTSGEQDEFAAVELDPLQPIGLQEPEVAATNNWEKTEPYIGILLHEGYIGFKNKSSKNYLTIPNGSTAHGTNVCQQSEKSIPNAQEFFLSYTWKPEKNMVYFTIYPVDLSGNTGSTRVKAGSVNASTGVANVSLQNFMPTEFGDRWQIEHYEDDYYLIHMASKPHESGSRYVLTAQSGEGSAGGSGIDDQGNVSITTYNGINEPTDSMLWQICADGKPIDIDSNDITERGSYDLNEGEEIRFFYIPLRFNESLAWQSSNIHSVSNPTSVGEATAEAPGRSTITLRITKDGQTATETSEVYVKLPDGVYYLRSRSTGMLLDLHKDKVKEGTPIQVYDGSTGEPTHLSQLYKFNYLGNGLYSIRSMKKNNMGISWSATDQSATIRDIGTSNTNVPVTGQWYLDKTANGYSLCTKTGNSKAITVPTNAASGTDLVVQAYDESIYQDWTITLATQSYNQLMITETFDELTAQSNYSFDVWYVTSDTNINGSAVVSWSIEQSEAVIERGTTANSFNTLIPGEATLEFTVTNAGSPISGFTPNPQEVVVGFPTPSQGDWFMENALSGKYASTNGQTSLGSSIIQSPFNDHLTMEWEFEHVTQNYFRIISKANGLYLTAPSSIISPVIQDTLLNDASLWKIEKTSGNRYKITSKAYEDSNYVLAIASSSVGGLYLHGYVDDINYNDEWYFNISGGEFTILAIADPDRTRGADAIQAANIAESRNRISNAIVTHRIGRESVIKGMETSCIFVSRSHGSPTCIQINDDSEGDNSMYLKVEHIYDYSTHTALIDLSGCRLAAFVACETGADTSEQGIMHAAVAAGAEHAIGFTKTIGSGSADLWTVWFLDYLTQGYTIDDAMNKALKRESSGDVDSVVVYPEY